MIGGKYNDDLNGNPWKDFDDMLRFRAQHSKSQPVSETVLVSQESGYYSQHEGIIIHPQLLVHFMIDHKLIEWVHNVKAY